MLLSALMMGCTDRHSICQALNPAISPLVSRPDNGNLAGRRPSGAGLAQSFQQPIGPIIQPWQIPHHVLPPPASRGQDQPTQGHSRRRRWQLASPLMLSSSSFSLILSRPKNESIPSVSANPFKAHRPLWNRAGHGRRSAVAAVVLPRAGLRGDVLHLPFLLPGAGLLRG